MTKAARLVLQDVRHAIDLHTDDLGGEEFRVGWFAIIGLLRAVGHVLANVNSHLSPEMKNAVERAWAELRCTRPQPEIFWGFIESERNRFLKSYEHGVSRFFRLPLYDENGSRTNASTSIIVSRSHGTDTRDSGINLTSVLDNGTFAGNGEIEAARLAVKWWASYLDRVDAYAHSSKGGS